MWKKNSTASHTERALLERCSNQSGDDLHEALTKFDYKPNMKAIF